MSSCSMSRIESLSLSSSLTAEKLVSESNVKIKIEME